MIPSTCHRCKGTLEPGTTEIIVRAGAGQEGYAAIVIRDVPAFICTQCGEALFSAKTSRSIDLVMDGVQQGTLGECCCPLAACEITLPD